jgi:hypothetical protein
MSSVALRYCDTSIPALLMFPQAPAAVSVSNTMRGTSSIVTVTWTMVPARCEQFLVTCGGAAPEQVSLQILTQHAHTQVSGCTAFSCFTSCTIVFVDTHARYCRLFPTMALSLISPAHLS